jgi:hypothetical protein
MKRAKSQVNFASVKSTNYYRQRFGHRNAERFLFNCLYGDGQNHFLSIKLISDENNMRQGRPDGLTKDDRRRFEELFLPHLDAAYNLALWIIRHDQDARDVVQKRT